MTDCSEIRNLLSEYLDDALDAKAKALADEHLRTCPACRKELNSLKTLVKEMGSLEPVKAPADFLDQLHRRMQRPSKLAKIREWLFYPLRVKIPLQLAGAPGAAPIIFAILPLEQSSLKLSTKPEHEKKDAAFYTDEAKGMIATAERSEAPVQQAAPAAVAKDQVTGKPAAKSEALVEKASPGGLAGERDTGKLAARSEAPLQKAAPSEAVKDKETREVTLNLKKQVLAKAASAERSAAQAPAAPAAQEVQRRTLAARAPAQEDKKEEGVEKEPETVLSITKAIEAAKGKVLSIDHNQQTGQPESVNAEMPAGQIPRLYEKLKELGELQVSPETGAEKHSDLVPIKIRLIVQQ
jgi:anti-sigma factor RsiW